MEFANIKYEQTIRSYPESCNDNIFTIVSQECSRRAMTWTPIYINSDISRLIPVIEFLENTPNFSVWLAGGAVIDLLQGRIPNDYDLFLVGDARSIIDHIRNIKNKHDHIETLNAISINIYGTQVQFIKRIYSDIMHVIGGFDHDVSRFAFDLVNSRIITTPTGKLAYDRNILYVNPYSLSTSFYSRIIKYKNKGFSIVSMYCNSRFKPVVRNLRRKNDYTSLLVTQEVLFVDVLMRNLLYLVTMSYELLFISNKKYELEEFIGAIKRIEEIDKKDNNTKLRSLYIPHIENYKESTTLESYIYTNTNNKICVNIAENFVQFLTNIVKLRYKHYAKITDFRISNTTSCHSSTFNIVTLPLKKMFINFQYVDIVDVFSEVLPILCAAHVKTVLPRSIILMIIMHMANAYIYKKISHK